MSNKLSTIDYSNVVFQKYFTLKNREVEITLKDQSKKKGKIIGFYLGDAFVCNTFISKWHISDSTYQIGMDEFGFIIGEIISNDSIKSIYFFEDNSIIDFK